MKETFAGNVRAVALEIGAGGGEFTIADLAADRRIDLVSDAEKRPLYRAIKDFMKAGEVERLRPGVYRLAGKRPGAPDLQRVMWNVLRSRRQTGNAVTAEDLMELSGASRSYALEWLQGLARRGVVRRVSKPGQPGVWQMVSDPVEMPRNEEKAERLREFRGSKRQRITQLCDTLFRAAAELRMEVNSPEEE